MMDILYDEKLKSVDPVTPAAAYIGGKSRLAKTIVKIIEDIPLIAFTLNFLLAWGNIL
ncbi:Uncharacterised protein [Candidatus Bartonella washoeensis]|uniref:Uncharacterized protein n=1 Tax=Candidatus Bartonella washoeensis Sb944nv TaxID=1094563 RepID=J1J1E5_9HYPH|nr:hypothetical protein [Bartonella washoeensis]EJF77882.1 hypothetical protein MCQ_01325 [Bartonella washoeensis Sb944nv]SPU27543.1 Uncharacterised protein [Bartonella washoeensis]